jgi:hypothetical protein
MRARTTLVASNCVILSEVEPVTRMKEWPALSILHYKDVVQ